MYTLLIKKKTSYQKFCFHEGEKGKEAALTVAGG